VKLAAVVILAVRGFQLAWPPLAYSVTDEAQARRLYALVTTAYVLVTGFVVAGIALLGRWLVRLLASDAFYAAHEALPWVALGWALYGLFLVFATIAGRARATTRTFPAAAAGLAANVVAVIALVEPLGIAGAGIALCAAYLVMLAVAYVLTRRLFAVPFEWRRLAVLVGVLVAVTAGAELLLPTDGVAGFASRALALAAAPAVLVAVRFFTAEELAILRRVLRAR
jgi:O-antigen/teichoic acid export membrane protein